MLNVHHRELLLRRYEEIPKESGGLNYDEEGLGDFSNYFLLK